MLANGLGALAVLFAVAAVAVAVAVIVGAVADWRERKRGG